ncbi:Fur family transcriptional regulator [Jannaschia aquimarina]|uniref:Zur protein n=1 Tax=Jannaschia aquimarina TaxID=935700 RepID=A0A0D1EDJ2_9RHOB|nr:Fur family transcriptional regulator [Jannaschia aquimarina]KIT15764.1 Zinc uptake regulation protein [Jannaschia aquimarina]SNT31834.1 Fur family transcriptional regulator, zinc uptake regulator [Jannaschia aquimarina]
MTSARNPVPDPSAIGFAAHDHADCVETAIAAAEARCAAEKLRLTPVRRRALEILLQEHRAMGAYAVLEKLNESGFGSQPPVAYRALDFLVAHGFAHKVERLNAFVACTRPGESHAPAFMICRICAAVAEAGATVAPDALGEAAEASGFTIERTVVEAEGICPACSEKADA